MTPAEKLALAQRAYAAFSALNVEAVLPLYHPECEWRMGHVGAAVGTDAYRGHDGLREWVAALDEGFESFTVVIDEARITREGVLLLRGHVDTRSRGTHMELSMQTWQEIEFREGLAFNLVQFDSPPATWDEATPIA